MTTAFKESQSPRLPSNYAEHIARIERVAQRRREENEWKRDVVISALIGIGFIIIAVSTWVLTK